MIDYLVTIVLIVLVMAVSIGVERRVRVFRRRHPDRTKPSVGCRHCVAGDEKMTARRT